MRLTFQGWQGQDCMDDIDECANVSICNSTPDSACLNVNGSYMCQCNEGFRKEGTVCTSKSVKICFKIYVFII